MNSRSTTDARPTTGLARRTVLHSAAWAVPAVAIAMSVPATAASGACVEATFEATFLTGPGGGNPTVLLATSPDTTETFIVEVSSTLAAGTTTTHNGISYNFSQDGSGWNGGAAVDGSEDWNYAGFGPAGAIVLNQRKDGAEAPADATVDVQEVTFRIFRNNAGRDPVTVTNAQIDIFDITSVDYPDGWRGDYWDAIGFDQTPNSITSFGGTDPGAGTGTTADPFHRSGGNMPTEFGFQYRDAFTFAALPHETKMVYTQVGGRQGWHFVSISGLRFTALVGDCLPNPAD